MDETGTLHDPIDRFFAVGMVKLSSAAKLTREIHHLRDVEHYYEEIKWNKAGRKGHAQFYEKVVDCYASVPGAYFSCFVLPKDDYDWQARFGTLSKAYEALARQLIVGNCRHDELVTILADEYEVSPPRRFEENVRGWANRKLARLAVTQVLRIRSSGSDAMQVADLLLGAVAFDCKLQAKLVPSAAPTRLRLLKRIRALAGVQTLHRPFRTLGFNVVHYEEA